MIGRSRKGNPGSNQFDRISSGAKVDTWVVGVILRGRRDCQLELVVAGILSESDEARLGVILHVDDIVDGELEGFEGAVEGLDRVGPAVAVGADQVAAVADVRVVEMVVGLLDCVAEADADPDPSHELLDSEAL